MKIAIIYDSVTGNTKKIAEAIRSVVKEDDLVYFGSVDEGVLPDASVYFLGSWTCKGNVSDKMHAYIDKLEDKRIAYFGTLGFCCDSDVYNRVVVSNVKTLIDEHNHFWYGYMCGGELQSSVLERYKAMKSAHPEEAERFDKMINNYYSSIGHPTSEEIEHAKCWAEDVIDVFRGNAKPVRYKS